MDAYDYAFSFDEITNASLNLARVLILETYPPEVIHGLRAIADALIETAGFEPVFRECVERAREHVATCRAGYNLPAKVAA